MYCEAHITVDTLDLNQFKSAAGIYDPKAQIWSMGNIPLQCMYSFGSVWIENGDGERLFLESLKEKLPLDLRPKINRIKLEIDPREEDECKIFGSCYYESHVTFVTSPAEYDKISKLDFTNIKFSQNLLGKPNHYCMTVRNIYYDLVQKKTKGGTDFLDRSLIPYASPVFEKCIYDNNVRLDEGWI